MQGFVCRQKKVEINPVSHWQPFEIEVWSQDGIYVVSLRGSVYKIGCCILDRLQQEQG